jgi:hypothetical protein
MPKFFAFLVARLLTTKFLTKLFLTLSGILVEKTKVKWDDKLHKIVKEALEAE